MSLVFQNNSDLNLNEWLSLITGSPSCKTRVPHDERGFGLHTCRTETAKLVRNVKICSSSPASMYFNIVKVYWEQQFASSILYQLLWEFSIGCSPEIGTVSDWPGKPLDGWTLQANALGFCPRVFHGNWECNDFHFSLQKQRFWLTKYHFLHVGKYQCILFTIASIHMSLFNSAVATDKICGNSKPFNSVGKVINSKRSVMCKVQCRQLTSKAVQRSQA